jgi:hypothetical protein
MNVRRLQGLALILSAVGLLAGLFGPQTIGILGPETTGFLILVSTILFILGIPAVNSAQPTGWIGMAGIVLLELAAVIVLAFRSSLVPSALGNSLSLTSAIAGMLGALITGWLTTRENVFPAWLGWAFIAHGLLNLFGGLFNLGSVAGELGPFLVLLQTVVVFTYGYFIYQKAGKTAIASPQEVSLS